MPRMGGFIATTFEDYTSEASVVHGGGWWTPLCQKELCPGYQRQAGALGGRQRTWFWRRIPWQQSLKALLSADLERHQSPDALPDASGRDLTSRPAHLGICGVYRSDSAPASPQTSATASAIFLL